MSQQATIVMTENRRTTAQLDGDEVRAPQVYVAADCGEHTEAIDAVAAAVGAHPNAVSEPRVRRRGAEWGELDVYYTPNELPVVGEEGVDGWLSPYRAEERVRETLMDELPDDYTVETQKQGHLVVALEDG